jgi:hypothetical protein
MFWTNNKGTFMKKNEICVRARAVASTAPLPLTWVELAGCNGLTLVNKQLIQHESSAISLEGIDMFKRTWFPIVVCALGVALAAAAHEEAPRRAVSPTVAAVLALADTLDKGDVPQRAKRIVEELDPCQTSRVFARTRPNRGGAGIGTAVQAGHGDSIEELVRDWSGHRPPTKEELTMHHRDLLRVAHVVQAMAELAPFRRSIYVPENDKAMNERWTEVCAQFKAVGRAMGDAIDRGEPAETRKVAIRLQQTCNACHEIARR